MIEKSLVNFYFSEEFYHIFCFGTHSALTISHLAPHRATGSVTKRRLQETMSLTLRCLGRQKVSSRVAWDDGERESCSNGECHAALPQATGSLTQRHPRRRRVTSGAAWGNGESHPALPQATGSLTQRHPRRRRATCGAAWGNGESHAALPQVGKTL